MRTKKFKIGDIFEDCKYHPNYCTCVDGDNINGISLLDGSYCSCSIYHCGIRHLNLNDVLHIREIGIKRYVREQEKLFNQDTGNTKE